MLERAEVCLQQDPQPRECFQICFPAVKEGADEVKLRVRGRAVSQELVARAET